MRGASALPSLLLVLTLSSLCNVSASTKKDQVIFIQFTPCFFFPAHSSKFSLAKPDCRFYLVPVVHSKWRRRAMESRLYGSIMLVIIACYYEQVYIVYLGEHAGEKAEEAILEDHHTLLLSVKSR
jgi:hypothetical protein